jgi:hypothetical protein
MATQKEKSPEPVEEPTERVVVRFVDKPGLRLIQKADFAAVGIDHSDVLWGPANNWMVDKGDLKLTDVEYARVILADRLFREERVPVGEE